MKKVNEFSILCNVDVCVVLYAPNFEGQGFAKPEVWPKDTKEEQLKFFASLLDDKLDACIQKINMLKGYHKGKAIAHESHKPCSYPMVSEEGRHAQSHSSKYIGGNLINQADSIAIYDPKIGTEKKDRVENDDSLSPP
ncbi:SRF-type transcription factor (DNA-binding and dimerization domain) protein [Medicago truncatula]|uniref:SRF-type transcription factor (DNA-binding and dimerization domain) protein n=1 Tax=Medicago truncatula TaxID=3880 RepID=A0A072TJB4_MEDTR|nr:SRF-type transcription factor (DNA-binding and dimerization domain) protein [Medicago truncatula]